MRVKTVFVTFVLCLSTWSTGLVANADPQDPICGLVHTLWYGDDGAASSSADSPNGVICPDPTVPPPPHCTSDGIIYDAYSGPYDPEAVPVHREIYAAGKGAGYCDRRVNSLSEYIRVIPSQGGMSADASKGCSSCSSVMTWTGYAIGYDYGNGEPTCFQIISRVSSSPPAAANTPTEEWNQACY